MPLTNPQAISLLRSNAYNAAKALVPTADVTALYTISSDYVRMVQPRLNHALMTGQIMRDPQFQMIVERVRKSKADTGGSGGTPILTYALYAGLAVGGWWLYKKYGKNLMGGKKSKKRSKSRKSGGGFIASLGGTTSKVGA